MAQCKWKLKLNRRRKEGRWAEGGVRRGGSRDQYVAE